MKKRSKIAASLDSWRDALWSELERARSWDAIRLDARSRRALVEDLSRNPSPPSLAVARLAEEQAAAQLRAVDWSTIQGARLVVVADEWLRLAAARDRLPGRTTAERFGLLVHWMSLEARANGFNPHTVVSKLIVAILTGPLALGEIERRLDLKTGRVGMWAGVWYLVARWPNDEHQQPHDVEVVALTRRLVAVARRHLRPDLRTLVRSADPFEGAVAETLLRKLNGLHPIEALALALDGNLDIMPTAIAEAATAHVTDGLPQSRTRRRRTARPISFVFLHGSDFDGRLADDEIDGPATRLPAAIRNQQPEPFTEMLLRQDFARKAAAVVGTDTVTAILRAYDERPQAWAARAGELLGVSRQTVHNRIQKARRALAGDTG